MWHCLGRKRVPSFKQRPDRAGWAAETLVKPPVFMFWIAVVMLVDAAIDLWGLNFWQKLVPQVNVKRLALIEALVALVLLMIYFGLRGV